MNNLKFLCPCHFGLEKTLSFEIKKIGGENIQATDGRVTFTGDFMTLCRANICLSVAERVGIVLGEFRATTFEELFQGVKALPIEDFVGKNDQFPNKGHSLNSQLQSIPACQKIIKKAMVTRLSEKYNISQFPEDGSLFQFQFSIMKDNVTIILDTTGTGLHKRGYRENANAAPIKETLAAGIIDLARIRQNDIICDPFCGSGTLLIESAFKAMNIAPCLNRGFSSEKWKRIPEETWREARKMARDEIKRDVDFFGYGFDIDSEAIQLSKENAKKAGVDTKLSFERRAIKDFSYMDKPIKIICNPPYGERLLEKSEAEKIYKEMGKKMLPLGENSLYTITPDEKFEELFGQKCDKNRKLYNGMIMCRLYTYFK